MKFKGTPQIWAWTLRAAGPGAPQKLVGQCPKNLEILNISSEPKHYQKFLNENKDLQNYSYRQYCFERKHFERVYGFRSAYHFTRLNR